MPNITCLSRIRNESLVLPDFLNHIDKIGDEFIFFDDASSDNSVEILRSHPKTKKVLRNYFWNKNQAFIQTAQRKLLLDYAKAYSKNRFFLLLEPDERIEDINEVLSNIEDYDRWNINAIYLRLLDGYMTKEFQTPYKQGNKLEDLPRMWGGEQRNIIFFFKKDKANYDLQVPGKRQPSISGKTVVGGFVKHYGKCLSVEHWNESVEYYIKSMPQLAKKWEARRGKALHKLSDFNTPLYKWKDVKDHTIQI